MFIKPKYNFFLRWLAAVMAIFFILIFLAVLAFSFIELKYKNKFYPNVYIGEISLAELSYNQAQQLINSRLDKLSQEGIEIKYLDQTIALPLLVVSVEGDLAYQIIDFNLEKSLAEAAVYGRQGNFYTKLKQKFRAFISKKYVPLYFSYNQEEIKKFLLQKFSYYESPAENAALIAKKKAYSNSYDFELREEKFGQILNYDQAIANIENNIRNVSLNMVVLEAKIDYPEILKKDCLNVESSASQIVANAPIDIFYDRRRWSITKENTAQWISLKKSQGNGAVFVGLDIEKINQYLATTVLPLLNIEPIEAKFEIIGDKVAAFQASRDGVIVDNEATAKKIENNIIAGVSEPIEIITRKIQSQNQTGDINDLGIKEIIGTGHSSFSGSPANRRHNIAVGAAAVNGTIIKPDEEFSLLAVLGETNAAAGYLPELVIKEGRTIPEYGGGLCQIGTTMFRATLESGLHPTMRRNHSYRVSYYEPAGTDATIYDPWPDYKFINDTPFHVLVQSRIDGDDLYFDFWSTEDGRVASSSYPVIYNIIKPGPTKIIETLDLEPGVKKCTEHAHNGADAYFDYQVKYPDGAINDTRFKSHYVPWREVCLLGVARLSEESSGTSSPEIAEEE